MTTNDPKPVRLVSSLLQMATGVALGDTQNRQLNQVLAGMTADSGLIELEAALSGIEELAPIRTALQGLCTQGRHSSLLASADRDDVLAVLVVADIQLPVDCVLFIEVADQPGQEIQNRILRREFKADAICFIGPAPEWSSQLVMLGHRVYQLPAGTVLPKGLRALKPHQSSVGVRWLEVIAGETEIHLS